MTQSPPSPLLKHPAFQGLSEEATARLTQGSRALRFELGQQLCEPGTIPARILVLLQGQARLLGRHNGRLTSVGKFGPGSVIGAASLLTGQPCENVIAADEVVAFAIPDDLWSDLYGSETSFRDWCDQQLWPQELLNLLEVVDDKRAETSSSPLEVLQVAMQRAQRCSPASEAVEAALEAGLQVYVTSAWGDLTVGQRITTATELPSCERFALRLVALPSPDASDLAPLAQSQSEQALTPFESVEDAEILPPISSYSPERNVVDSLRLIRADGACRKPGLFPDAGAVDEAAVPADSSKRCSRTICVGA